MQTDAACSAAPQARPLPRPPRSTRNRPGAPDQVRPDLLVAESGADLEGHGLRRTMGLFQLVCFGVGAIVGTGIFVGLSDTVAEAGPAVVVSFVLAAITCIFTAFSFAELGGAIPVSGSSYSFAYATLGERVAFLVGWCLLLEYGVSVSAVAVGWSQYLNELLDSLIGWNLPAALSSRARRRRRGQPPRRRRSCCSPPLLLVRGIRESARATAAMAVLKIGILILFCAIAFTAFEVGQPLRRSRPHGIAGHHRRRLARLLLVHRLRRDHHGRRRGQEPAQEHPDRDHDLHRRGHAALLRWSPSRPSARSARTRSPTSPPRSR